MRRVLFLLPLAVLAGCGGSSSAPASPTALPTATAIPTPTAVPRSALNAVLTGRVTDAKTGKPIARATISLGNRKNAVGTNAAGEYRLPIPSGHSAAVFVSAPGYTGTLSMGRVAAHSVTRADFKLIRSIPGKANVPPFPGTFGKP